MTKLYSTRTLNQKYKLYYSTMIKLKHDAKYNREILGEEVVKYSA